MCNYSLHCPFSRESETAAKPEVAVLTLAESRFERLKSFVLFRNVKLESSSNRLRKYRPTLLSHELDQSFQRGISHSLESGPVNFGFQNYL